MIFVAGFNDQTEDDEQREVVRNKVIEHVKWYTCLQGANLVLVTADDLQGNNFPWLADIYKVLEGKELEHDKRLFVVPSGVDCEA